MTKRRVFIVLAVVLVVAAVATWLLKSGDGKQKLQFETAKIEKGRVVAKVTASGLLSAIVTVQVGSQVSGRIASLHADWNSPVKKGQLIAKIDPALYQASVDQARANLAAAQGNLAKAKVQAVDARRQAERQKELAARKLNAQADLDTAQANADAADAQVAALEGNVAQTRAALQSAEVNLAYTNIVSPTNGTVISRNVDVGQTVAASLQAPTIFTIARDLTKMQVYAKIDESDVGRIKIGQRVTFKVDAFPEESFDGAVSQVRMNATTVQNVVTYDAIIDFANPRLKLFPGMTAYVNIPVATVQDAVKLPNAALRYKPPYPVDQIRALYAKYGLQDAGDAPGADSAKAAKGGRGESGIVWILRADNTLEPVRVTLGITDHAFTEVKSVVKGELKAGDEVVTGSLVGKSGAAVPAIRR
jgi:HlyD family secretion protein